MVYIYKKNIGGKTYYYLRASIKKNNKQITKDIAYLGDEITKVQSKLDSLNQYKNEIRKAYKNLNKFIETNKYLEQVNSLKLKKSPFLSKEDLNKVESCKLHWKKSFSKLNELTKKEILKQFIVEFAFNTASIEGNTISLKQAQNLLMENLSPKNKTLREIYDLQNTEKVFWNLYENKGKEISHELICEIHSSLLENIDDRTRYRTDDVRVFKMNFKSTPKKYVKTDMDILINWFKKNKKKIHPFVLSVMFHHKFEKIHPFMDGNGRTGRMLMNLILMQNNYPPIIVRKKNRVQYLKSLNTADKSNLDEVNETHYKEIISFMTKELEDSYWNIFL